MHVLGLLHTCSCCVCCLLGQQNTTSARRRMVCLQAGAKDSSRAFPEQEVQEALLRGLQTMAFSAVAVRHLLGEQGLQPLAAQMASTNACLQVRGTGC